MVRIYMVHVFGLIDDTMSAHLRRQLLLGTCARKASRSLLCICICIYMFLKSCAAIRNQMTFEVVTVSVACVSLHSRLFFTEFP